MQRFGPDTGTVRSMSVRGDGEVWASWSSAASPTSIRRLDVGRQDEGEVVLSAPGPAAPPSVAVEDVWVDGTGGRIHALLRRPTSGSAPWPLVVEVHGGPTHHDVDAFGAYPSAWVDHGFAVVQVNYRGSTGYGSAWRDALEERVGHVELEDVLAVRDHLVSSGVADADRVVLAGASWGGYLTLLGLGTQPGSWALGLAGVPVADYVAAYEDEMEGLKAFDRSLFGGSPDRCRSATPTPARSPTSTRSTSRCWCWPARTTRAARSGRSRTTSRSWPNALCRTRSTGTTRGTGRWWTTSGCGR